MAPFNKLAMDKNVSKIKLKQGLLDRPPKNCFFLKRPPHHLLYLNKKRVGGLMGGFFEGQGGSVQEVLFRVSWNLSSDKKC